ncbi:MAG: DUF4835 family protein [Bacteroidia bacterium]|nr:DUF4835 family protein [Bacteroidia bacterium]
MKRRNEMEFFMRLLLPALAALLLCTLPARAQEIDLSVEITMDVLTPSQKDYLSEFQQKLLDYVNDYRWTEVEFYGDRIPVRMSINFNSGTDGGEFTAQVVIDAQRRTWKDGRPTAGTSLIVRILDQKWAFSYIKGQPIIHDDFQYNEIASFIDFYIYLILGMDFDSYEPLQGSDYYQKALTVAQRSQAGTRAQEWRGNPNQYSRLNFISEFLNAQYESFRTALYWYYYEGLDFIETEKDVAQQSIGKALESIATVLTRTSGRSLLLTMWLDAKSSEFCRLLDGYAERGKVMSAMVTADPARSEVYRQCMF